MQQEFHIYQIAKASGPAAEAWIDVTKDVYDDAEFYPADFKRRLLYVNPQEPAVPQGEPDVWVREQRGTYEGIETLDPMFVFGSTNPGLGRHGATYSPRYPAAQSQPVTAPSLIAPNAVWLIHYDDADRRPEILTSEQAARAYFKRISGQWNAHLFVKVESNSRDDRFYSLNASMATAPAQEPVTLTDEEIRRNWSGGACPPWGIKFARAIIAALREKEVRK